MIEPNILIDGTAGRREETERFIAGAGAGAHRRLFDPRTLLPLADDFPFGRDFLGGLFVG